MSEGIQSPNRVKRVQLCHAEPGNGTRGIDHAAGDQSPEILSCPMTAVCFSTGRFIFKLSADLTGIAASIKTVNSL